MQQPVSTIAGATFVSIAPDATLGQAIRLMKENGVGCLPVVSKTRLVGILTERDILLRVAGKSLDPDRIRASEIMTADPESVEANATLRYALHKMSVGGFRHIPITDEGCPTGLVSAKNVLKLLATELNQKFQPKS
jgi:CBS domain-containing protein